MSAPGPKLETLTRRLLETPADLLLPPRAEGKDGVSGVIHVDALVSDTLRWLGGEPLSAAEARTLCRALNPQQLGMLRLVMLACQVLHDPSFRGQQALAGPAKALLLDGLRAMAGVVRPELCVSDPDRREELARQILAGLSLHPAGEKEVAARDRLTALDSVARARVAREAAEAEKRARAVREAAAKAAAEAASYYGRE